MKTILVIYSDVKLSNSAAFVKKKYPFLTASSLKVGDRLRSPDYSTDMQVVGFMPSAKWVNKVTGELSNKHTSTEQLPLRELRLTVGSTNVKAENVIKAHKVYDRRTDIGYDPNEYLGMDDEPIFHQ
jgi:hypothetical protein